MKRRSTFVALVGSLVMAGALGVACGHQQRRAADQPPPRPLGESTAMGPSDPTHSLEVPQTKAPPIENVPTLSTPIPAPVETPTPTEPPQPITTVPAPTPAPVVAPPAGTPSPDTTPPRTPSPVTPPSPTPAPAPPVTQPGPSVPPSMMPMQTRADAGVAPTTPMRDGETILPRDAAPNPPPTSRTDSGAIPITPR